MSDNAELMSGEEILTTVAIVGKTARPVQYTVVDGRALTEGCIILGSDREARDSFELARNTPAVLDPAKDTSGFGLVGENFRWKDGKVIFEIDDGLPNAQRVEDAMRHWTNAGVGISFEERVAGNGAHDNFVRFVKGNGCSSTVGMRGGMQELVLGDGCTKGNCIHEIGHTLGMWHEQSRIDRDLNVRIRFERIQKGREFNFFQRLNDGFDIGAYDPGSIMHYPLDAFSVDGQPTIELLQPYGGQVGQRDHLSDGDKAAIRQMYGQ